MKLYKYWFVALTLCITLVSCSSKPDMLSMEEWDLVWISDSSGWDVAEIYAAMVEEDTGVKVNVSDNWIGGLPAGDVYHALQGEPTPNMKLSRLPELIQEAEIIVFYANPTKSINETHPGDWNCVSYTSHANDCDMEIFDMYIQHLEGIYELIFELRAGQPTIVRAYDAYNARINLWKEQDVYEECKLCWTNYNAAIHQAAESYNIPVAAVAEAWNGPEMDEDPNDKGYCRDSVHPNELGGEVIAMALRELGYDPVTP